MFIPLYDNNDIEHIRYQWVTLIIIIANIVFWLVMLGFGEESEFSNAVVLGLGFIPSIVNDVKVLPPELAIFPDWMSFITYAFIHGGILHLAGNLIFIWVFGDNVEDALGHARFILFYCACAAAGAFAHGLSIPNSDSPLIGASGAAAGVATAYLFLHPRVRIWTLAFGRIPLPLPSYIMISLWILFQIFMFFNDNDGQVSWAAHVGGIIAGAILVVIMRRRGVQLFAKQRPM